MSDQNFSNRVLEAARTFVESRLQELEHSRVPKSVLRTLILRLDSRGSQEQELLSALVDLVKLLELDSPRISELESESRYLELYGWVVKFEKLTGKRFPVFKTLKVQAVLCAIRRVERSVAPTGSIKPALESAIRNLKGLQGQI